MQAGTADGTDSERVAALTCEGVCVLPEAYVLRTPCLLPGAGIFLCKGGATMSCRDH